MFSVTGPTFLLLYGCLIAAVALVSWRLRARWIAAAMRRGGASSAELPSIADTPQLAAYLRDGRRGARATRLLELHEGGARPPLDEAVAEAQLASQGLLLDGAAIAILRWWAVVGYGSLLAAGLVRFVNGVAHARPVGYLVLLLLLVAYLLYKGARRRMVRTPIGDDLVAELRHRRRLRQGDLGCAMGFAVAGWAALESRADLREHLQLAGYTADAAASRKSSGCVGGCVGGGCIGAIGCGG